MTGDRDVSPLFPPWIVDCRDMGGRFSISVQLWTVNDSEPLNFRVYPDEAIERQVSRLCGLLLDFQCWRTDIASWLLRIILWITAQGMRGPTYEIPTMKCGRCSRDGTIATTASKMFWCQVALDGTGGHPFRAANSRFGQRMQITRIKNG